MTKRSADHDRNAVTNKVDALQGIKIWMVTQGINAREISKMYGRSEQFISLFLNRKKASRRLVKYLVQEGCPREYFEGGKVADVCIGLDCGAYNNFQVESNFKE